MQIQILLVLNFCNMEFSIFFLCVCVTFHCILYHIQVHSSEANGDQKYC